MSSLTPFCSATIYFGQFCRNAENSSAFLPRLQERAHFSKQRPQSLPDHLSDANKRQTVDLENKMNIAFYWGFHSAALSCFKPIKDLIKHIKLLLPFSRDLKAKCCIMLSLLKLALATRPHLNCG